MVTGDFYFVLQVAAYQPLFYFILTVLFGMGVIGEVQKSGIGYFQILYPGVTRESISTLSSEL